MTLGILVTNYNTWELTSQCIGKCFEYAEVPFDQFLVVDDCSSEIPGAVPAQIKLIRNKRNLGLIRSLNRGLKNLDSDLILLLDSDAWPLENYVKGIKEYFRTNPEVGIATFQTVNAAGTASASFEAEPGVLSLLLGQQLYQWYLNYFVKHPKHINVFTCAMVLRKEVLEDIGLFDQNFDWLELDHDICMRASRRGWKIGVMPLKAFHKGSGTPQKVSQRVIRFYRNRWYLLNKFGKIRWPYLVAGMICFRLGLEFLLIWTLGTIYYRDVEVVKDKAHSRKEIIKYFLTQNLAGRTSKDGVVLSGTF
ncbi:glycosyl transferase [Salinimicrobium marinum]|uniref:Glycosyl transferase n=1 Tax=Salinimicrobium marinum TaxID=680283 RepID=A0A918SKH1_9FLAO|nr:glycosyltransferase [Salinimicrobium marinum]GHA48872.1 glycosyl transferase [Salinimicrobium marinum]